MMNTMTRATNKAIVRRGEVWMADMGSVVGSEQGGLRPVVVVQNNIGNKYSPTTIVAPATTKAKKNMKTHVEFDTTESGLPMKSTFLLEQLTTIDKTRFMYKVGYVNMDAIDEAIGVSLGLMFPMFRPNTANTYA